jgi:ketosteroid isomerase-like protein
VKRSNRIALILLAAVAAAASSPAPPAIAETNAELADQVSAAETAFAKTMADRDHAAFGTFVADEAIFFGRKGALRGKSAVIEAWKPLYEGAKPPFSWAPEQVEVLDSGTLAISSGPVRNPEGKQTGVFSSIWRRERDGRWKVLFDKGCDVCDCPPKP